MCSKIFVKIHAVLRKLHMIKHMTTLTICPMTHVPHPPRCPISIFSINHDTHLPTLWSCAQLPMFPIAHVPHIPRYPISVFNIMHDTPLPMCPIAHVSCCTYQKRCQVVRKMSSCQKDVNLSKRCQMSKSQTHGLWRRFTKIINWHNKVHTYWCQFWRHISWLPKPLKMCIESVFEQFWWPSYLTSKLTSICVNLIMWIFFFCEPPP